MQEIEKWLSAPNPSYQEGLNLLKKHSYSKAVLILLSLGITRANWQLLRQSLQDVHSAKARASTVQAGTAPGIHPDSPNYDSYKLLREINRKEFSRVYNLFLHNLRAATKETRYQAAREIVEGFEKVIIPTRNDIAHYEDTGRLPDQHYLAVQLPESDAERMRRMLNLRSRISKNRHRADRQADLERWRIELKQLEENN